MNAREHMALLVLPTNFDFWVYNPHNLPDRLRLTSTGQAGALTKETGRQVQENLEGIKAVASTKPNMLLDEQYY